MAPPRSALLPVKDTPARAREEVSFTHSAPPCPELPTTALPTKDVCVRNTLVQYETTSAAPCPPTPRTVLLVKVTCENVTPLPLCMYTAAPDAALPSTALLAKLTSDRATLEQLSMANAPPYALPTACVAVLPVNDDCARYTSLESVSTTAPPDRPLFWVKRQRSSVMLAHKPNDNAPPKLLLLLPKFVSVTSVMVNEKSGTSCVTTNDAGEASLTMTVPMLPLVRDRETAVY